MGHHVSSTVRLLVSVVVGVVVGVALTVLTAWQIGVLAGWMAAAAAFILWLGVTVFPMDATQTQAHAAREDPNRGLTDLVLVVAAIASLGAVVLVLTGGKQTGGQDAQAALSVASVVLSWTTVHMLFVTRYARAFYGEDPGCIDFNTTKPPRYVDFAYLAFTIGMTFQVSDTPLKTTALRAMALRHALVSYLFGVGIIATMINLVAGLGK
ncbi:MAG: DUF1345 domain-containing protein [Actinomycetota bacterium]|nr:DUF1345 domain-containing protein [Actinomycetota bacterium]